MDKLCGRGQAPSQGESVANSSEGPDSLAQLRAQLAEAGPTIAAGLGLPAPRVLDRGGQTPARVNVTCVTPLGEEVASTP